MDNGPQPTPAGDACPAARLSPGRDALIGRHMGMAAAIAAEHRGRRLEAEELESIATLALVEAADRYDLAEHAGYSFAQFARYAIRRALHDALCAAPMVRGSIRQERAAMKGHGPGWRPYAVPVDQLTRRPEPRDAEAAAELVLAALAECDPIGRAVVDAVCLDGLALGEAARRLGLTRRDAREAYDAALLSLAASCRARGLDPGPGAAPCLASAN